MAKTGFLWEKWWSGEVWRVGGGEGGGGEVLLTVLDYCSYEHVSTILDE